MFSQTLQIGAQITLNLAIAFVCTAFAAAPGLAAELTVHPMRRTAVIATVNTLEGALIQAYQNNPQLNAQRASVRATDENVPQALSGYRPRVSATASVAEQYLEAKTKTSTAPAPA